MNQVLEVLQTLEFISISGERICPICYAPDPIHNEWCKLKLAMEEQETEEVRDQIIVNDTMTAVWALMDKARDQLSLSPEQRTLRELLDEHHRSKP